MGSIRPSVHRSISHLAVESINGLFAEAGLLDEVMVDYTDQQFLKLARKHFSIHSAVWILL